MVACRVGAGRGQAAHSDAGGHRHAGARTRPAPGQQNEGSVPQHRGAMPLKAWPGRRGARRVQVCPQVEQGYEAGEGVPQTRGSEDRAKRHPPEGAAREAKRAEVLLLLRPAVRQGSMQARKGAQERRLLPAPCLPARPLPRTTSYGAAPTLHNMIICRAPTGGLWGPCVCQATAKDAHTQLA
eukprot:COSAG05_NODE_486_length_9342_cov_20.072271_5_plen_183_part_00